MQEVRQLSPSRRSSIWRNTFFQVFGGGAVVAFLCLLGLIIFLPESSFTLSRESRLPRWFTLPPGLSRSDVIVTMDCYNYGSTVTFTFAYVKSRKTIARASGKTSAPIFLKSPKAKYPLKYPRYNV